MKISFGKIITTILLFTSNFLHVSDSLNTTNIRRLPTCSSNSCSQTCTGHDACKNYVWNGTYVITCGASNSERTCRSTTLNCGVILRIIFAILFPILLTLSDV